MADNLLYTCKHCEGQFLDLSEHYQQCARKRAADDLKRLGEMEERSKVAVVAAPKPERLAEAGAVLAQAEAHQQDVAPAKKFDRNAYQREYMRRRRAVPK